MTSKILKLENILNRFASKEITLFVATSEIISIFAKIRNNEQNAKYWVWLSILESETGNSKEALHKYFKYEFLTLDDEILDKKFKVLKSTTKLTKIEFMEYLNKIQLFCNEFLNITLE